MLKITILPTASDKTHVYGDLFPVLRQWSSNQPVILRDHELDRADFWNIYICYRLVSNQWAKSNEPGYRHLN